MNRAEYRERAHEFANRGTDCHNAKLTDAIVATMLRQHEKKRRIEKRLNELYSAKAFAKRLGMHPRAIEKILRRESWIHVDPRIKA